MKGPPLGPGLGGYHLAQPGAPPWPKNVYYPKPQTSNLKPLLAGVSGCVFACVRAPLVPATPGWGVRCGSVCLNSCFGCAPPLLTGVSGCVCACVRAPLVPRHSWLGCAVWVCVLGLGFPLRPATPGRGVGVCVCLCARSAGTPPLLAWACGVGVRAWARVSLEPRHSWLGCRGVYSTPQPGKAGNKRSARTNTHPRTATPTRRCRRPRGTGARAHTHPNSPSRSGGAQPKLKTQHARQHCTLEPETAGGVRTQPRTSHMQAET